MKYDLIQTYVFRMDFTEYSGLLMKDYRTGMNVLAQARTKFDVTIEVGSLASEVTTTTQIRTLIESA